jgi:hypothetical protein
MAVRCPAELESGKQVTEPTSKGSRLRGLNTLLEYVLAEAEALGLPHLDKLLGAAALAVSDELDKVRALPGDDGSIAPQDAVEAVIRIIFHSTVRRLCPCLTSDGADTASSPYQEEKLLWVRASSFSKTMKPRVD